MSRTNDNINYPEESSFVNSIIGEGTKLKGEFDLNGLLRIDGVFSGKVRTGGKVLIGKNGVADCDIVAGTVIIGGKVKGEIIAMERIILLSTGELIGNIKTPRLMIEEGVIFDGSCEIIEDKDKLDKLKNEVGINNSYQESNSRDLNIDLNKSENKKEATRSSDFFVKKEKTKVT